MKAIPLLMVGSLCAGMAVWAAPEAEPATAGKPENDPAAVSPPTNAAPARPERFDLRNGTGSTVLTDSLVNRLVGELREESVEAARKPNEAVVGRWRCSGVLVQLFRSPNPLQLLNPWAPPEAGSGEQNLVRDPVTGAPSGLKLLAVNF